jgi:hypothetical protein
MLSLLVPQRVVVNDIHWRVVTGLKGSMVTVAARPQGVLVETQLV